MGPNTNHARLFSDILSVDGWHSKFCDESGVASVHVDVGFHTGQLGAEPESNVRFKLSLRRAVVTFVVPPTEPIQVLQASVDRGPQMEGTKTVRLENATGNSSTANAAVRLSATPNVELNGSAAAHRTAAVSTSTEITGRASAFEVHQSKDALGNYRWEVIGTNGENLFGHPWDPVGQPRLSIKRRKNDKVDSTGRVTVSCRKQDLVIQGVELKESQGIVQRYKANRMAAAEALIRKKLCDISLTPLNFEEKLSNLVLADVTISQGVEA